jgi:NAD-dependent dihydropyrimidine dehydrogenase PreA subunit
MIVLYFSGTGNTEYAAMCFAKAMVCDCVSIEDEIDFKVLLDKHETLAIFYPIYGSAVPMIMRRFVNKYQSEFKGKQLIIFCTQVMFSGDGARAFTDLLKETPHQVIYARHLNMPNNISNLWLLPVKNHPAIDNQLLKVRKQIQRDVQAIHNGNIRKVGFAFISKWLGFLTQRYFFQLIEKKAQKDVRIQKTCIHCGLCVKICPMNNLIQDSIGIQQKGQCTLCYRCVNQCPKGAITVLLHNSVRQPYHGIKYDV